VDKLIRWFSNNHLLANFIMIGVLLLGVWFWHITAKEEMPNSTWNRVMINASWAGASPEDMERFITRDIEDAVSGRDGVVSVTSTSSRGSCSVVVELNERVDYTMALNDIRTAVAEVKLPDGVDDPFVRGFMSSQRAVVDIVIFKTDAPLLSVQDRVDLQESALVLQSQLESLPEVLSADMSGYYQREYRIIVDPVKLEHYRIPFTDLPTSITNQNLRQPAGILEDRAKSLVSIDAELDTPEELRRVVLQGNFDGPLVFLEDVAVVEETFEEYDTIRKVNGREAVTLRVVKNADTGIIVAADAIRARTERFKNSLSGSGIDLLVTGDDSQGVRDRLALIASNGLLGFILILILLFVFLDFKSGFWVAMGIPFSFCFTMVLSSLLGQTINNMTLAAVIIVMGMVVDDAIVVTENITRLRQQGMPRADAVVRGTASVVSPVIASVITTMAAFVPLLFFSGIAGRMSKVIPPIVILMLAGSLFESLVILPSHMQHPLLEHKRRLSGEKTGHWFFAVERFFGRILDRVLHARFVVIPLFVIVAFGAVLLYKTQFQFSLFPGEESDTLFIDLKTPPDSTRLETEAASREIEVILDEYIPEPVENYQTTIAGGRFGGMREDNRIYIQVSLTEKGKKKGGTKRLSDDLQARLSALPGFTDLVIRSQRFGFSSGSAIEILVQENDPAKRLALAGRLVESLLGRPDISAAEADTPRPIPEYKIDFDRETLTRLGINPQNIRSLIYTAIDGRVLYDFPRGSDTVEVRLITDEKYRRDIDTVFNLPVANRAGYLVPLSEILEIRKVMSDSSISRIDSRRTTSVMADLPEVDPRPLMKVAEELERDLFPVLEAGSPGSVLTFGGEVAETRKIGNELLWAVVFTLVSIYMILSLSLKSLWKPFLIMLSIPLGAAGAIFAFRLHGITTFGFYAGVGLIGLAGVVVNDSIVLLDRLDQVKKGLGRRLTRTEVAETTATRLRAVFLTTATTVIGLLPTAYGIFGYDPLLSQMMLALAWGLMFGTLITLVLIPSLYLLVERPVKDAGRAA
jgi:multidrug efflux pump subunit AcrB